MENGEESFPQLGETADENLRQIYGIDETTVDQVSAGMERAEPFVKQVGDYELIEELGRGGMGVVFKARQCSLNRIVAIKMILGSAFSNTRDRLRFQREAELIAALKHPNIIDIHEIGEFEGQPFYSMEYIEGTTLNEMVREKPLGWTQAARFAQMIAQAMQFAHAHGVIHRDLKPHNVMVDGNQNAHVTDFGLARDVTRESGLTIKGEALGTPNYMSPEQCVADSTLTAATDIYAIGGILYEMVTSIPPFMSSNVHDLLEKVKNRTPIEPRLINPSIPADLNTICMKCLEKDPYRRYLTAGEVAEELDCVLRDMPIRAKPISPLEHGWRWCKRNRTLASVMAAASAIILIGTATAFVVVNHEKNQAISAQHQAESTLAQLKLANDAIVAKNKELQDDLDTITHQKGVIATVTKTNAEQNLAQAEELFHEVRLSDAQTAADKIVATAPNLPGGWYLEGQLALAQGNILLAQKNLQKAADLSPEGLDATGQSLLALVNQYAQTVQQTPNGKLTARDSLNLLHDLRGREEYLACVDSQRLEQTLLVQTIRSVLAFDNGTKFADVDHVSISEKGEEVILMLKDIPNNPDLSAIRQFPIFTSLQIQNTGISDLTPFAGMQLSQVELIDSPVVSLDPLRGMPLSRLTLKGTKVQDLTPIKDAPLRSLTLDGVPFPPDELLQAWPLDDLQISGTPLPANFTLPNGVRTLGLARTGLTDLQFLASSSLTSLDVSGNPNLTSLDPLHKMTTLVQLDLSDTGVSTLLPLAGLGLENLSLRNTPVTQIAAVKDMPLQELDLRGCKISDLSLLTKPPPSYFPPQSP